MQVLRAQEAARLSVCMAFLFSGGLAAFAHQGDPALLGLPYASGFDPATVPPEQDPLEAAIAYAVERAGTLTTEDGRTLLPPGATFDSIAFDASNFARLSLTLRKGVPLPSLSEAHGVAIGMVFGALLADHRDCAGLSVQVRQMLDTGPGPYVSIGSLVAAPPPFESVDESSPDQPAADRLMAKALPQALGGPVANADGQPAGALTGVVVFCAAGHGWTVNDAKTAWVLQRPLLLEMNEDYGNLDQLNYFVNYLHNAGAIVVPFRPVGYQDIEVVLDNDDPGVTWSGTWNNSTTTSRYYENGVTVSGVPYRWARSSLTETAVARYTPNLPKSDFYPVYCFTKHDTDRVPQTYRIRHSGGTAQVTIDHFRVGNGWIWLGNYYFEQGASGYVEITNQSTIAGGSTIADAIRFGNGAGDVVGAGVNRVSGRNRDEEGQRYWAESELRLKAVGFPSSIWNCCTDDIDDNTGAAARWAAEMNRLAVAGDVTTDRWRSIYIEFHTNAHNGAARGTVALWNDPGSDTTHQLALATIIGEKVEADMVAQQSAFEYPWGQRNPNTYNDGGLGGGINYGAISRGNNGNEFDATLLEVAFHDNAQDAANLRNAKVRDAVARSTVHGIIDFLSNSSRFPGTQVPAIYPPDPPERLRAVHDGNGNIVVSWTPGPSRPSSPASGNPATGYKIYRSSNGYGFGNALVVGNVTTATLTDIPPDTTVYLRVAATNAGGESMPTSTLAVRRPVSGPPRVLIVDGFDRVSRQQSHVQVISGKNVERPIPRRVNSFDYIVQHAAAIDAAGVTFDSCVNEAVIDGTVSLGDYGTVVWILGEESTADRTFDSIEQDLVTAYLSGGGRLLATGSEIGYELDGTGAGRAFYENVLRADYVADSAGTYSVFGSGGILADVGAFNFNPANGAPYVVDSPDQIAPLADALPILTYSGGAGGTAGIQYDSGVYRVVLFGFPFEAIASSDARNAIMQRVLNYLAPVTYCVPRADFDCDGDVDQDDFGHLQACLTGSGRPVTDPACQDARLNPDPYIDGADLELFRRCLTRPGEAADPDCMSGGG